MKGRSSFKIFTDHPRSTSFVGLTTFHPRRYSIFSLDCKISFLFNSPRSFSLTPNRLKAMKNLHIFQLTEAQAKKRSGNIFTHVAQRRADNAEDKKSELCMSNIFRASNN